MLSPGKVYAFPGIYKGGHVSLFQMFFSAQGRIRRRDFWLWIIVAGIVNISINYIANKLLNPGISMLQSIRSVNLLPSEPYDFIYWTILIFGHVIGFCLYAKRGHDRNRPAIIAGLYIVLNVCLTLLPKFMDVFMSQQSSSAVTGVMTTISGIFGLAILIDFGCLDGTKGPNRYGPSPKGIGGQAEVF